MANKKKPRLIGDVKRVKRATVGPSRTKREMKDSTDVNNIIKKYERTGILENAREVSQVYEDVSEVGDYHSAVLFVQKVQDEFLDLPSKIRGKFKNDPQLFYEFVNDPKNNEECYDGGLLSREAGEKIEKARAAKAAEAAKKEKEPPEERSGG